ncbi:PmoA family protein [Planctomicrobium sp. SH668]|uniref:DUF6807 domain-containing protein n=1 Tax=Planctomicrobium sp. SH668 TaxID=3448126 RepID=UPI003F5C7F44
MRVFFLVFAVLGFSLCSISQGDERISYEQGDQSVKILIGEDVFTVFHYGTDRRKPFFLPVTGPGGFDLLRKELEEAEAGSISRKVVVVSERVALKDAAGRPAELKFGEIVEVSQIDGNQLKIVEPSGWLSRSDVAPLGAVVTRLISDEKKSPTDPVTGDSYDHPHHKGIWFSVDEIDGIRYWMEGELVRSQSVFATEQDGKSVVLKLENHWLDREEKPVLIETTKVTITPDRMISYDATLTAAKNDLHIGDTKEGLFAIRLAGRMCESKGGGPVTTSNGVTGTQDAWGRTAAWINYDGPVDGNVFGVTMMDAPENAWKSRYHVRNYGLFSVNPFGDAAYTSESGSPQPAHSRTLQKGDSLRFRYGLWVHGPDVNAEKIESQFQLFAESK